jgi:hypothetical protein
MNIVFKKIEDFNINNIYFFDKIKNNIIHNGFFIKIIYSTSYYSLNSILINIPFVIVRKENKFNKTKCMIDVVENKNIIEKLKCIESNILKKIGNLFHKNIEPSYKLFETLNHGILKIFYNNSSSCIQSNTESSLHSSCSLHSLSSSSSSLQNVWETVTESKKDDNKIKSIQVILKISGIWISENNYGLSYKFNHL